MLLATALMGFGLVASSLATSQSASSFCEAVTETVTVNICQSETLAASAVNPATTASFSTITSFSTLTNYVTVTSSQTTAGPVSSSLAALPSSSGYYYIDHNGTTSWLGGVSPTATYSSYVTQTVEVTIVPTHSDFTEVTVVQTKTLTVTPPAVTSLESQSSTILAIPSDDITTTSTVTSYLTKSVISIQTVFLSSRSSQSEDVVPKTSFSSTSSAVANGEHTSHSTVTASQALSTLTDVLETSSESICSASYVDVTTDVTYTVLATASTGLSSSVGSAANISSLVSAASASNATYTFSGYHSTVMSSPAQKTATVYSSSGIQSVYHLSINTSSVSVRPTGYVPFMPVPAISFTMPAALSSRTSSTLTKMYTNTSSSVVAPTPSVCGEHGDFTLTWEDEPSFLPTEPITDPTEAPPVFNPYHHMYFSDGFVYVPPPQVPFAAVSSPRLVMFVANETGDGDNHSEGGQLSGEIGAGTRRSSNAFWFNAYSAYLGCDNVGPEECNVQISGLVYQNSTKSEVVAFQQNATLPPCLIFENCQLTQVKFAKSMKGLSGIRIQAFNGGESRSWFMDNLALGWYNNSCDAGLLRGRSH